MKDVTNVPNAQPGAFGDLFVGEIFVKFQMHQFATPRIQRAQTQPHQSDPFPTHNLFIRWATKNILQRILRHMYADLERMEHLVKDSDLNWSIVRPPRLTYGVRQGKYRVAIGGFVKNGQKISRADVADFIVNILADKDTFRKTVELAY